jgi:hypothetical protein
MKQTLRLALAVVFLTVAVSTLVAGLTWATNHAYLKGPAGLSREATPPTSYVSLVLHRDDVTSTYLSKWKEGNLILGIEAGGQAFVELDPGSYEVLMRDSRLLIQGMVTSGMAKDLLPHPDHPAPLPKIERYLLVLHSGEPYPAGDAWYLFAIGALTGLIAGFALRSFLRNRRPRESDEPHKGWIERLAAKLPGLFALLGRYQLNGFGLELMDFHDPRPDGSFVATRWLTAGFMPIGPVDRVRVRSLSERVLLWIPFVVTATSNRFEFLEKLAVDRSRSLRVYLFYYLVFLPLAVGPVAGLFLWFVLAHDWSAAVIWCLIGACLAWGVGMIWMQDVLLKRPRPHAGHPRGKGTE